MIERFVYNINLWKNKAKTLYILAFCSLLFFSFLNTYANPEMLNQPLYNEFVLFISIVFETVMALLDGFILALIVKIFIKITGFKKVILVMFAISLLINSLLGILNIILIIFKMTYIKFYVTIIFALFKSIYFCLFVKLNFTDYNKKTIIIGVLWILLSSMPG